MILPFSHFHLAITLTQISTYCKVKLFHAFLTLNMSHCEIAICQFKNSKSNGLVRSHLPNPQNCLRDAIKDEEREVGIWIKQGGYREQRVGTWKKHDDNKKKKTKERNLVNEQLRFYTRKQHWLIEIVQFLTSYVCYWCLNNNHWSFMRRPHSS